jgi:DNA-binding MarR family transcriptional regulator
MNDNLIKRYIQTMFRFRKTLMGAPKMVSVNMNELFVLSGIANGEFGEDNGINLSEIERQAQITKAAISQMLTSLDKRGLVVRETDRANRRKITVELTAAGKRVLSEAQNGVMARLGDVLVRFGEDKTERLLVMLNELLDMAGGG